ncbi:hypothetical protein LNAOJCKE_0941 [Methylorubrum aminovorans]|uniref:Uncharacterized protein n=1 Tax=Methylorubrum aminovorans TaxID=269069 RepID=A0ABQ4UB98_9HYPH|nr:hypothetical protein [Methylorubrum aminovorans]GJE63743.1 hypothetical protein LNAOJCKE_0941 [Methylorubrum aminovorans]GMA73670.1 hypothetical protein GCM10025880_00870 [Methylorubrum aminovorans]
MDPVMLRNQALNMAMMRAKKSDSLDDIKKAAEGLIEWMEADGTGSDASKPAEPTNQPSTTHESQAAVEGQEPKGE